MPPIGDREWALDIVDSLVLAMNATTRPTSPTPAESQNPARRPSIITPVRQSINKSNYLADSSDIFQGYLLGSLVIHENPLKIYSMILGLTLIIATHDSSIASDQMLPFREMSHQRDFAFWWRKVLFLQIFIYILCTY